MKTNYKGISLRLLTVLLLLSLPFLGSDCEDIINQISPTGNITGDWTLIYNEGTRDICPGEKANFPSSTGGTATLECPQGSPILRLYQISSSNVLTYTETGVEYQVSFTANNELVLTGVNNNRVLYYSNQISGRKTNSVSADKNTGSFNSSELK